MMPVLLVAPPGHRLPPWLEAGLSKGQVRRVDWIPETPNKLSLGASKGVVVAGWNNLGDLPGILVSANQNSMEPSPIHVGLLEINQPPACYPGIEFHLIGVDGDPERDWSKFLQKRGQRSFAHRLHLLLATAVLLLVSAFMGAALITLWSSGYDRALQQGLMLIDGLEGARPRLVHGESYQALQDRMKAIASWGPESVASNEIADRVGRAGAVLRQWLKPLDEAASWPELEDVGTLERLEFLAQRVKLFHPEIPFFSDSPLGREAMARRNEILQAVADANRQIQITTERIELRRELLALTKYRSAAEPDWSRWYHDSNLFLSETAVVPPDSPVMLLREVRKALFLEKESIADLSRSRKMVEILGLAGPGMALLVPPDSGADAVTASHRMSIIRDMAGAALPDLCAAGLPSVFIGAIRNQVDRSRTGWLAGGGKQVLESIRPLAGGIGAWRESVARSRDFPVVNGWDQLVSLLCRMAGPEVPPLEALERYLKTANQSLYPCEALVEFPEMPPGEMVLVLANTNRSEATVRLAQAKKEKRNGGWLITFRAAADARLAWFPGEPCLAVLVHGDKDLAIWQGPARQAVGTEGIWGKSSKGIPSQLRWQKGDVPEPPAWFVEAIR